MVKKASLKSYPFLCSTMSITPGASAHSGVSVKTVTNK